jgi:uncharacterized protein (TIGR02271 family)
MDHDEGRAGRRRDPAKEDVPSDDKLMQPTPIEEHQNSTTHEREVGEVRVTKWVRTEREQVRVPTRREEVSVERVPVEEKVVGAAIGEEEISVPVKEEEAVVHKHPIVKEEIRIRKNVVEDDEVVQEDVVRREPVATM